MTRIKDKTRPIRVFAVSIALSVAFWSVTASLERLSAQDGNVLPDESLQADGGRQTVDDTQPGRQDYAVLLLRRCGTELPPVWAFVHVGVGAASVSIPGSRMAIADGQ